MGRKRDLTTRGVKKLTERERAADLDPEDETARWLGEHDPPPPPATPKSARSRRRSTGGGSRTAETLSCARGIQPGVRSDAQLVAAAREDPEAFRCLYDRYAERLHAFFARRTGSRDAALDLTAETFAQAWISRRRFRDLAGGSAGPWLFTIARRVLIASVKRRRLEATALERLQVEHRGTAVVPDERWLHGLDEDLAAALDTLPREQRRALELRVVGGLSYAGVAERLGCSPTAARIRVSRGLARLRARLEGGS